MNSKHTTIMLAAVLALTAGSVAALAFNPPRVDFSIGQKFNHIGMVNKFNTPGEKFVDAMRESRARVFEGSNTGGTFRDGAVEARAVKSYGRPGLSTVRKFQSNDTRMQGSLSVAGPRAKFQRVVRFDMTTGTRDWTSRRY